MKEYKASYDFLTEVSSKKGSETVDGYEGSLIDNFLVSAADGIFYFFREVYKNCWQSEYIVREYGKNETNEAFKDFYNCQEEYNKLING